MALRLKWFKCPNCELEYEDLVDQDSDLSEECEGCGQKNVPILDDFLKQIHIPGRKYRHVSWSLWQAGN